MDQISCCLFGSKLQKQWTFDFLERKCLFWFSCWIPNTNYCSQRPIIIFCNSAILCQNSTKIKIRRPTFWKWHFQNIILDALKNPFSIWLYLLFIDRYMYMKYLHYFRNWRWKEIYGLAFARCRWAAHLQRANARLGVLIWHSRAVGERLGFFFSKIQNKPYFSTVALYLALECSLWEHSGASAHLWRANARSYVLIWHSRAVGELLTYSAPMPDKVCWSGIRAL